MGLFDWLFGREEQREPPVPQHMTEEEFQESLARVMELERKMAERNEQTMQAIRVRMKQRQARERRGS